VIQQEPVRVHGIDYTGEPGIDLEAAMRSSQYIDWLMALDKERFRVRSIHFQSVDCFGSRIAFIKFKADVVDAQDKFIPGIIFMRGGSVGILPVFNCEGQQYAVLTIQPRLATGRFDFAEIPAGMLDGSSNFAGTAAKELKEELDLTINADELTDLSALAGNTGIFVSPGGTDETIRLFSFTRDVSREELNEMNGRLTGLLAEGEQITLKIVPLDAVLNLNDAKSVVAYSLYKRYCT